MRDIRYLVYRRNERLPYINIMRVSVVIILFISIFSLTSTGWAEGQSGTEINVGYYNNRPLSYKVNGELFGLSVELLREIGRSEGWELEFVEGTRGQCHEWLANGKVDLVASLEETPECKTHLRCSNETQISNWGVIYTGIDREIGSILELEDKWVGVVKDDIHYNGTSGLNELMNSFKIEAILVEFDNYGEVIDAIEDGNVDAGLLNHLLGQAVEHERDISRTGIVFNPVDVKFAFCLNDTDAEKLSNKIDQRLKEMKNDESSVYYTLLEEYVGGDSGPEVRVVIPTWIIQLFLIVLGVAVLLFAATMFLRYRVRSRTRELEITNQKLDLDINKRREVEGRLKDERNRSVFYLDLLVHDMGNINQGLLNSTQIYQMVKKDRGKADSVHETISQLVDRSVSLVKNVHKFARATTAPFKPEPIELMPVVKKSLASVILSFPEEEVTFEIMEPKERIFIPAEPLIEEVFYNIFHNAVKYHELGAPRIEVRVKIDQEGGRVVLEITDRGRGIPDNMKSFVFTRAHKAGEAKHLGIGLSLVTVLLDRYNGTIEVTDRVPGNHKMGSKFIVTLPITEGTSNPPHGLPLKS